MRFALACRGAKVITNLFGHLDQGKHNTRTEHDRWNFSLAVVAEITYRMKRID